MMSLFSKNQFCQIMFHLVMLNNMKNVLNVKMLASQKHFVV